MRPARLVLVRHGITDWNREGRFQGHLDPPLSEEGRTEAHLLGRRMVDDADLRPGRIVSSSLARALETAEIIGAATGVPVDPDPRLIEIGQGEWEGRTHDDLAVTDAERYAAWRDARGIREPPGGEPVSAATRRVGTLLEAIGRRHGHDAGAPVCLVSHGGTLRIVAGLLLRGGELDGWSLDVDNASVSVLDTGAAGWRIERWNDTRHLLGRVATHVDEAEGRPLAL